MTFAYPVVLVLVPVLAALVVALYAYDRYRRESLTRRLGELPVIGRVLATASPGRRLAKTIMAGTALLLIAVAVARPQVEGRRKVETHGLDVVVAVDVSKSMLVDDVGPTPEMTEKHVDASRLARARELALALLDELPDDRIAPVVFAGAASHFPLTEDHVVAGQFLTDLGPADLPAGSNLTEVLRVSRCLLRPDLYDDLKCSRIARRGHGGDPLAGESLDPPGAKAKRDPDETVDVARGKAIVVFTDGADATPEAKAEVAAARELGIAVLFVGIGTPAGGEVHEIDAFGKPTSQVKKQHDGSPVVSTRDDVAMRDLAETGGDANRYLIANPTGDVDPEPIVAALQGVDRGLTTKKVLVLRDIYQPLLFAALMLLVIEAAISTRRRRRFPEDGAS